jgi:hypothetical protein
VSGFRVAGIVRVLAGVVVVSVLSGCSETPAEDTTEPSIPQVIPVVDVKTLGLPLDRFTLDAKQSNLVERARVVLVVECLRDLGFEQETPPPPPVSEEGRYTQRYGITEDAHARNHGYHPAPGAESTGGEDGFSLEPVERQVVTGQRTSIDGKQVPQGGCGAEAERKLSEGVKYDLPELFFEKLLSKAFEDAREDSRVRAAFGVWSACMRKSGFDYPDPWAANNDPRWLRTEVPSKEETATATADVACKRESNVVNINAAVERAYQERVIERNPAPFAKLRARVDAQVRNARAVTEA